MTLLSVLAAQSIALPLSPAFPANELRYILDQSQACLLLSSAKFEGKAGEVMREGLENEVKHVRLEKRLGRQGKVNGFTNGDTQVRIEGESDGEGGMMLYTSGTTNRPVSLSCKKYRSTFLISHRKVFSSPKE